MRLTFWLPLTLGASLVACGGTTDHTDVGGADSGSRPDARTSLGGSDGGTGGGMGGATADAATASSACPAPPTDGVAVVDVSAMPNVAVATLAGGATAGAADGPATAATFSNPVSVIVEPAGSIVVCDFNNDSLRRVDATGTVSTLTHAGVMQRPYGMAFGADGTLYVDSDYDPAGNKTNTTGTIWRVDVASGDASAVAADIGRPRGLGVLADGRLVLGDFENERVLLLDPKTAAVSTLVAAVCPKALDGGVTPAPFALPYGVAVTPTGTIIVADETDHLLRTVTLAGAVSTYAGTSVGSVDGPRLTARFDHPTALAVDAAGDIFVSDIVGHRIRRVAADGTVVTVAGNGMAGFADGAGASAEFYGQEGIAVTPDGLTVYVADGTGGDDGTPYNRVRKITITP
jgi:sugar lactone lactonase YvrE